MEWRDEGILLAVRRHGESAAIVEVFTPSRGRHAGVVRGGAGRRLAPMLQPGAQLDVGWRARLEDHIGAFQVELQRSRAALLMADPAGLAGLGAICALLSDALPERAAFPALYARTVTLLDLLAATPAWPLAYLRWEVALLAELGFALDLDRCAVSGATEGLAYVSPRTGRAVSAAAAGGWADRLLPAPPCLLGQGPADDAEIALALATTGHFLSRHVMPSARLGRLPAARDRMVTRLGRKPAIG